MNRILSILIYGSAIFAASVFGVEWKKESSPFSMGSTGVISDLSRMRAQVFTCSGLSAQNKLIFKYSPIADDKASINIYSINGTCLGSYKLLKNSTRFVWDNSAKKASGTYTAILNTSAVQKTIKFVIAN